MLTCSHAHEDVRRSGAALPRPRAWVLYAAAGEGPSPLDLECDVSAGPVRRPGGVAHIGVVVAGGQHQPFHRLADLILAAGVSRGQLADRAVHIGLAPELGA